METEVRKGLSEVATFKQRPEIYSGVGWVGRVVQSRMQDNPFGRKQGWTKGEAELCCRPNKGL